MSEGREHHGDRTTSPATDAPVPLSAAATSSSADIQPLGQLQAQFYVSEPKSTSQNVAVYQSPLVSFQHTAGYQSGAEPTQPEYQGSYQSQVSPGRVSGDTLHATVAPTFQVPAQHQSIPTIISRFVQQAPQQQVESQQPGHLYNLPPYHYQQHLQQPHPYLQIQQPPTLLPPHLTFSPQSVVPATFSHQTPSMLPPVSSYRPPSLPGVPSAGVFEPCGTSVGASYPAIDPSFRQTMVFTELAPDSSIQLSHVEPGQQAISGYPITVYVSQSEPSGTLPGHVLASQPYSTQHTGQESVEQGVPSLQRTEASTSRGTPYSGQAQQSVSAPSTSTLSPHSKIFEPRLQPQQQRRHQHLLHQPQQLLQQQRQQQRHPAKKKQRVDELPSLPVTGRLPQHFVTQLHDYGKCFLSDQKGPVRIPAVTFNEQKFEDPSQENQGIYYVLHKPQGPAERGQEALSRVCRALEQVLQDREEPSVMITDYKYKECFLRKASEAESLTRGLKEGSHNILVFGPNIGIIFIQVTCMDNSTNPDTKKKQTREKLKQLEKDEEVFRQLMDDLGLPEGAILKLMALPNVSMERLKNQLQPRTLKKLMAVLGPEDDPDSEDGLLTSDLLPDIGHRHWPDLERRESLAKRLDGLFRKARRLPEDVYFQIFARYTCGLSTPEVWTMKRDPNTGGETSRREIRTLAHAVSETALRYRAPVLTPEMDGLIQENRTHVIVSGEPGCGTTFLLLVRARLALKQDYIVVFFLPRTLTGLRRYYEKAREFEQHCSRVYFWDSGSDPSSFRSLTCLDGTTATLDNLRSRTERKLAVFDCIAEDPELVRFAGTEAPDVFQSIWAATDKPIKMESSKVTFYDERLTRVIRVPTSFQAILRYGLSENPAATSQPTHPSSPRTPMSGQLPNVLSYCDASSGCGLPTDGLDPLIIWHPRSTRECHSSFLQCSVCGQVMENALRQLAARPSGMGAEGTAGDAKTGENNGNVPPALRLSDCVAFTDDQDRRNVLADKLSALNLWPADEQRHNIADCVHSIEDLPAFRCTEKAVVVYVGSLEAPRNGLLREMTSKLRDLISLCQGRLILALEVDVLPEDQRELRRPYQLELELALQKAEQLHSEMTESRDGAEAGPS